MHIKVKINITRDAEGSTIQIAADKIQLNRAEILAIVKALAEMEGMKTSGYHPSVGEGILIHD